LADDAERWRRVLAEHGPALLLFARQWSASAADAEDAVQNGFVKFWRNRKRARDELAYLYSCIRSAAMDLGKGERRRRAQLTRHAGPAFEIPADRQEREAAIEAALMLLPADQREVIVMKIWGGLTFAQIGAAMGVSMNTAASRFRYAILRLHAELSAEVSND
jgi:RNA polymerase sigma-70 factor (ECF subfamily)